MPSMTVIRAVLTELFSRRSAVRHPEPELVMAQADKAEAFDLGASASLESIYLFNAAHASSVILPGDTVVDLACGSCSQLGLVASLNPETRFVGVDLSEAMLSLARRKLETLGLRNVELVRGDVSDLRFLASSSVDVIISTLALHHLPDLATLNETFAEICRCLRPGGGLYLFDLGHLKTERAIEIFAAQGDEYHSKLLAQDYLSSMRAAFFLEDFRAALERHLKDRAEMFATYPIPFMVALKSHPKRALLPEVAAALASRRNAIRPRFRQDFDDLSRLFAIGGLRSP